MGNVVSCAARCSEAGRFKSGDPELIAHQMWIAVHGLVTLELGEYLIDPYGPDRCFEDQLIGLMVGAGDTVDAATRSVTLSRRRLHSEVETHAEAVPAVEAEAG